MQTSFSSKICIAFSYDSVIQGPGSRPFSQVLMSNISADRHKKLVSLSVMSVLPQKHRQTYLCLPITSEFIESQ